LALGVPFETLWEPQERPEPQPRVS
jgi:hypothetical protein